MKRLLFIVLIVLVAGCVQQSGTSTNDVAIPFITSAEECLADTECFGDALETCSPAKFEVCAFMGCELAEITGRNGNKCIVHNWYEIDGEVKNVDETCEVPAKKIEFGYNSITYPSRLCDMVCTTHSDCSEYAECYGEFCQSCGTSYNPCCKSKTPACNEGYVCEDGKCEHDW